MVRLPWGSQLGRIIRTVPPVRWESLQAPEGSCVRQMEGKRGGTDAEASFSGSQGHPPKTLVIFPFCKCNQGCE